MNKFKELLQEKGYTAYRLNKEHRIPTNTVNDLCSGKTEFKNVRVGTALKLAKVLGMSIEEIYNYMENN